MAGNKQYVAMDFFRFDNTGIFWALGFNTGVQAKQKMATQCAELD